MCRGDDISCMHRSWVKIERSIEGHEMSRHKSDYVYLN